MEAIKTVEVNHYAQQTAIAAQNFERKEEKQQVLKEETKAFYQKYSDIFESKARFKVAFILATIGHFAAVFWEGSLIQPLCEEWLGDFVDPSILLVVSLLPIFVLFSFSIAIGHSLHLISFKKHDLEPGRFQSKQLQRAAIALLLIVIYIFFLYYLMLIANEILEESLRMNEFIIILGAVELVLGYFAILGWEILFVYFNFYILKLRFRVGEKQMAHYARRCSSYNLYFYQRLGELDEKKRAIYLRQPPNEKVKRTIKFFHEQTKKKAG